MFSKNLSGIFLASAISEIRMGPSFLFSTRYERALNAYCDFFESITAKIIKSWDIKDR